MFGFEVERMDWDSKFWGIVVYNATKGKERIFDNTFNFSMPNCNSFIIQALVEDPDIDYINFLEDNNFRFVETKITLKKEVKSRSDVSNDCKKVAFDDIEIKKNEFYNLFGKFSRYSLFGRKRVNEFYYTWVVNSIKGEMDDECIGYYDENELAGFTTFKIRSNDLIIGLIGVFSKHQGKSISQRLLNSINKIALDNNCKTIYISTQGKNLKAINAYIKNGFFFDSIRHWYYFNKSKYGT